MGHGHEEMHDEEREGHATGGGLDEEIEDDQFNEAEVETHDDEEEEDIEGDDDEGYF